METGYWVGGIACVVYGLFCIGIGVFRPQAMIKLVKKKLKLFTGGKEPSDKATTVTCAVFGAAGLIAAVIVFVAGVTNY